MPRESSRTGSSARRSMPTGGEQLLDPRGRPRRAAERGSAGSRVRSARGRAAARARGSRPAPAASSARRAAPRRAPARSPPCGRRSPASTRSRVVLPAPLPPSTASVCPSSTRTLTPASATRSPYRRSRRRARSQPRAEAYASAMARMVGINHVALTVGDVDEAVEFYGRIFELELRGRVPGMAFLDMGDQFLALAHSKPGTPDRRPPLRAGGGRPRQGSAGLREAGVERRARPRAATSATRGETASRWSSTPRSSSRRRRRCSPGWASRASASRSPRSGSCATRAWVPSSLFPAAARRAPALAPRSAMTARWPSGCQAGSRSVCVRECPRRRA